MTKEEAKAAAQLYRRCEGIDILSPAAVALASLIQAKQSGRIDAEDSILLNISGGGVKQLHKDIEIEPLHVDLLLPKGGDINRIIQLVEERIH